MKPEGVKIVHIAVDEKMNRVYGLGDDSMVYRWAADSHTWSIWAQME
jgi:hypothetical protein